MSVSGIPGAVNNVESVHSEDKPFYCEYCDKNFKQKFHLTVHTRSHTGEKPFECSLCEKSFISSINLKNHMTVHSPKLPNESFKFSCNLCNFRSNRSSGLYYHKQTAHNENFMECDQCSYKTGWAQRLKKTQAS